MSVQLIPGSLDEYNQSTHQESAVCHANVLRKKDSHTTTIRKICKINDPNKTLQITEEEFLAETSVAEKAGKLGIGPRVYGSEVHTLGTMEMEFLPVSLKEVMETIFYKTNRAPNTNHAILQSVVTMMNTNRKKLQKILEECAKTIQEKFNKLATELRVYHPDLHPENIMFRERLDDPFFIDFGNAVPLPQTGTISDHGDIVEKFPGGDLLKENKICVTNATEALQVSIEETKVQANYLIPWKNPFLYGKK